MKSTTLFLPTLMSFGLASPLSLPNDLLLPLLSTRQTAALNAETDRLLFAAPMSSFLAARSALTPAGLDWSSDGCSSSPNNPFGFDFLGPCTRHDFGYRNYKAQYRFVPANKKYIDDNFRADMYDQCAKEVLADSCRFTADMYYRAVRWFGDFRTEIIESEDGGAMVLMIEGNEMERVALR